MTSRAQDRDPDRDLNARMLVAEEKIDDLESEVQRHRDKLHSFAAVGEAVRLMVTELGWVRKDITAGMETLRIELRAYTEDRLHTAIDAAFLRRTESSKNAWDTRTKVLMVLIALAGWLTAVAQLPDHRKAPAPIVVTVTTPTSTTGGTHP